MALSSAESQPENLALGLLSVLLISLIWVQVFVGLSPDVHWDIAPTVGQPLPPITVLGPAGLAWLDSALLIVSTMAMGLHIRLGGRVVWWAIGLAMLGVIGWLSGNILIANRIGSGWREAAWVASVMGAMAVYHLSAHPCVRRSFVAVSLGAIIPLTLANLWYGLVDHPETVRFYLEHESQTLIDRGWQAGSPQHLAYRRRLMSPDAVGFIGLSNVQGTILASLAAMAFGQAIERWRRNWRQSVLAISLALVACLGVALTRSRGAMLALAMAMVAVALLAFGRPLAKYSKRFSVTAMLLVLAAVAMVIGRGLMGPPATALGERSLLFRFHYWQAAWRTMAEGDFSRWLFGVGSAENFKELYAFYKPPLNPEEVLSTHNMAIDFVVMLGVGGLAWALLLAVWLWQSGRMKNSESPASVISTKPMMFGSWVAVAATLLVMLPSYWIRMAEMWWGTALLWLVGAVGMGAVACGWMSANRTDDHGQSPAIRFSGYAAALVLMIHSQIEMTFFQPGACAVAWMMVALAAASSFSPPQPLSISARRSGRPWLAVATMGLVAVGSLIVAVLVTRQQQTLGDAALAMSQGNVPAAIECLERASDMPPAEVKIDRQAAELRFQLAQAAHQQGDMKEWNRQLELIRQTIARAQARGLNHSSLDRMLAQTYDWQAVDAKENPRAEAGQTMALWGQIAARRPHDFSVALSLAQACERAGDFPAALKAYRRTLDISQHSYLDPLMQMSRDQEQAVRQAIERLEKGVNKNAQE